MLLLNYNKFGLNAIKLLLANNSFIFHLILTFHTILKSNITEQYKLKHEMSRLNAIK
jgi:hypothetical protein